MHLGPNTKQLYSVGSSEHLSSVNETRDLGIWMDLALKFLIQCSKTANKAMQALGWIKRTLNTLLHSIGVGTGGATAPTEF